MYDLLQELITVLWSFYNYKERKYMSCKNQEITAFRPFLDALREEINEACIEHEKKEHDTFFSLQKVTMTLKVAVTKGVNAKGAGKIGLGVINLLDLGTGAEYAKESVHEVTLEFSPLRKYPKYAKKTDISVDDLFSLATNTDITTVGNPVFIK